MRERLKEIWKRRPRLRRGWKLALDLGLCALLLVLLWGMAGYPLPTAELEFRRLERAHLMPRSEIVLTLSEPKTRFDTADGTRLETFDRLVVGLGTDWAAVASYRTGGNWDTLEVFPLEDGPSLVPAWHIFLYVTDRGREDLTFAEPLLVVRTPEEAARGELVLDAVYREREYHRESPLWDLGEGVWLAAVAPPEDTGHVINWFAGAACTLTLYRADGSLLLERSGVVPLSK